MRILLFAQLLSLLYRFGLACVQKRGFARIDTHRNRVILHEDSEMDTQFWNFQLNGWIRPIPSGAF